MRDKEADRERGRDSENKKVVAVIHNSLSGEDNVFLSTLNLTYSLKELLKVTSWTSH